MGYSGGATRESPQPCGRTTLLALPSLREEMLLLLAKDQKEGREGSVCPSALPEQITIIQIRARARCIEGRESVLGLPSVQGCLREGLLLNPALCHAFPEIRGLSNEFHSPIQQRGDDSCP